jgi:nicotinate-nucleotide adenylyltransferase
MKIGLYFGSFNPVHIGHLIIASHIVNNTDVEQIWFVVSPQNPLKKSSTLLNEYHRLHLVRVAIEGNSQFKASDSEFKLPKPSYTIDTITYLKEKYPQHAFSIIMGSDSFQNVNKWKNYEQLIRDNRIIIYERPGFEVSPLPNSNTLVLKAPLFEISATEIRQLIKQGKSIQYIVPDKVLEEIEQNGYYK